jgi:hypothetical protein
MTEEKALYAVEKAIALAFDKGKASVSSFTLDDLRKAFEGGRDSKNPMLKCIKYGDNNYYASSEIVKSFETWVYQNYRYDKISSCDK